VDEDQLNPHQAPTPRTFSSSPSKNIKFSSRSVLVVVELKQPNFASVEEATARLRSEGATNPLNSFMIDGRIHEVCPETIAGASSDRAWLDHVLAVGIAITEMSGIPTGKDEEQMINLFQPPCQSLQARNTPQDQKITVKVCGYWLPPIQ